MSYGSTVLADSPSLLWMLDETSGTAAADATGNGRPGTYTGGFTLGTAGPPGVSANAVTLDGTTGFVFQDASQSIAGAFTHEIWVKTTAAGHPATGGSAAQGASSTYDRELVVQGTSGDPAFYVFGFGSVVGTAAVNDGAWHYLAGVFTGDGGSLNLYADGALAGTVTSAASSTPYTGYWLAGRSGGTGGGGLSVTSAFFSGALSAFAVYPVALTAAQVSAHYAAAAAGPGAALAASSSLAAGAGQSPGASLAAGSSLSALGTAAGPVSVGVLTASVTSGAGQSGESAAYAPSGAVQVSP